MMSGPIVWQLREGWNWNLPRKILKKEFFSTSTIFLHCWFTSLLKYSSMLEVLMELMYTIKAAKNLLRCVIAEKWASIFRGFAFLHFEIWYRVCYYTRRYIDPWDEFLGFVTLFTAFRSSAFLCCTVTKYSWHARVVFVGGGTGFAIQFITFNGSI